ncbi:ABC transporter permease subunit [Cohnella sp. CFH 77786]|uniref:carbohydrate ABC transporter permease n=1 Tax=Cohnella sp. CFH 77786 TaxID=2662265 RepID=UPI001C60CF71|nr:sugar ABC transporter permease [Cohnella sp. CFH 77786]MBW5445010.1 ABC transporter permease subunit [Cohnella sp. CFH 77786]
MKNTMKNPAVYWAFVLPSLALYFLFFIYTLLTSVGYGFTDWNALEPARYTGLANFRQAFADSDFWVAVKNNLYFILFSVFLQVPLILFFSLLISGVKRLQGLYKTTVFMPSILSTSIIGILWGFLYHPNDGLFNKVLELFGAEPIMWLGDTKWAMVSILITNAWQWMGFYIVLILAAIISLPKEINEAAAIDGASGFQRAARITVPLIMPIISVVIMLSIAGAMRVVDIVLVMTNGGPAGATEVMASYMVNQGTRYGEYGYAMALSILIFAIALLLTALYQITFARKIERIDY